MLENITEATQIKSILKDLCDAPHQCGFDAYVVTKESPKLKSISFSEEKNDQGKTFRTVLKEMFFSILQEQYLDEDAEYSDGRQLADNQNKYLIFEQGETFCPFEYLNDIREVGEFSLNDIPLASGLVFQIRKGQTTLWLYQHLWSIMIPNKKKTNFMTRLMNFENRVVFSEQKEHLLTISSKVDIIVIGNRLITRNTSLLQKYFGFHEYIYRSARQTVCSIENTQIVENVCKLTEYIERGKTKYAKKMMRIGTSKVFNLTKEQLIEKVNTLPRWRGKFQIDPESNKIFLSTYSQVEDLIDLFDERYTRSEVTDTEYDTDVKTVAPPTT